MMLLIANLIQIKNHKEKVQQTIRTKWIKLERDVHGNILNAPKEGGVYTFIYNKYPFYFGTAEKGNLDSRLKKHATLFKTQKRTYLDMDYFNRFNPWTEGLADLNDDSFFEKVFVPDISGVKTTNDNYFKFSEDNSLNFWRKFEIFFASIENSDKKVITTLEKNLQITFQNIYFKKHKKNMLIPKTISTFFGKIEAGNFMNDYKFEFDTSNLEDDYFKNEILIIVTNELPNHCFIKTN